MGAPFFGRLRCHFLECRHLRCERLLLFGCEPDAELAARHDDDVAARARQDVTRQRFGGHEIDCLA